MKVVITQPTYLPWMGYFGMMDVADTFLLYDDVQFERRSWQCRNKIKFAEEQWLWLSVPIVHQGQDIPINKVEICNSTNWREKHWKSIYYAYHKAPYFGDYKKPLEEIYHSEWVSLCDLNTTIIQELAHLIGVNMPRIIKTSELEGVTGNKTDRLLSILTKIGADAYISSRGAENYLEPEKFKKHNIKLYWYQYHHPVYPQIGGDFMPYMSVIDLLFNTGEKAMDYIRKGLEDTVAV